MQNAVKWGVHSLKNFVEAHVSDYETPFDALYEYTKNLEEAPASSKNIFIEFHMDRKIIAIYGDGKGLDAAKLNEMRVGIGKSSKGITHHGLGILAFMRFAKKMIMFSRKNKKVYVLSCIGENDDVVSDVGESREISSEDTEYAEFYNKLHKFGDDNGTVTVLEGVGQYKSDRFNFTFNMREEFESKKFIKWFQLKCRFSLMDHVYMLKKDENSKLTRITEKMGHGTKMDFTVPSADHPVPALYGQRKNIFEDKGRQFELKVRFLFWVSNSNDGEIRISENHQDSIPIRDAIKFKITPDSVFKHPDYTKYLTGAIDFKIKPLDGGDGLNVYSGTRTALIMDGGFGDCLCNILNYADQEVIRPKLNTFEKTSVGRKDERRSSEISKDMQIFFRDNPIIADKLLTTQSTGKVTYATVKCPRCGTVVMPKRGGTTADLVIQKNNIYAPENVAIYICGTCGNRWDRRSYDTNVTKGPQKHLPIYTPPEPGQTSAPRQKKRGHGYRALLCPLAHGDDRRAALFNDLIKINRNHMNYKEIESERNSKALWLYERYVYLTAIVDHEMVDAPHIDYARMVQNVSASLIVWQSKRSGRMSLEEVEKVMEETAKKEDIKEGAKALGERWGGKVKTK